MRTASWEAWGLTDVNMQRIEQLAKSYGVIGEYSDWAGNPVTVSTEKILPVLSALGLEFGNATDLNRRLKEVEMADWEHVLPPVVVMHKGADFNLLVHIPLSKLKAKLTLDVVQEDGVVRQLVFTRSAGTLKEVSRKKVGRSNRVRLLITLPSDLPDGYHQLKITGRVSGECSLIVAPETCYEPQSLMEGNKIWGSSLQLYTLNSERNWGMGDFTDLKETVQALAARGADIVGLNPIHALYPAGPEHCSPYSPSSRNYLNPLYIDVEAVQEYADCEGVSELVSTKEFIENLEAVRSLKLVDYKRVSKLKMMVLEELFIDFCDAHLNKESERAKRFRSFCREHGEGLERQALYDTLFEMNLEKDAGAWGWGNWPKELQNPESPEVKALSKACQRRITFYLYLQWLADMQLQEAQEAAKDSGMAVGLYRDLAVGVDRNGADTWSDPDVYCLDASVGAPPDGVAPQGQNWGLPPFNPVELKKRGYQPFIEMVRSNMNHCGALRIDHVMGLFRLWWCPNGKTADYGCYVRYPLKDLLGIIKLESQRNKSLVFGEDLGTVPDEIAESLPPARFYSNTVGLFEKEEGERFTSPAAYRSKTLACLSNHDIPTLAAWWDCLDLEMRLELGIYNEEQVRQGKVGRHEEKVALLNTLSDIGELPTGVDPDRIDTLAYTPEIMERLHYYLMHSNALISVIQLEDCLMMDTPVNIPGTTTEYPNWRRRLTGNVKELLEGDRMQAFLDNVNVIRSA